MFVEVILIPTLDLKVSVTSKPKCFKRYKQQWAMNDDGNRGPVGWLLLDADCTQYFPSNFTSIGKQV